MLAIRRAAYAAGMMMRETGQALDRAGCSLQGSYAYKEQLSRHRQIMNLEHMKPIVGERVFLAPNATLIGDVVVGDGSSVWYGAVLRGDRAAIKLGEGAVVQDRAVLNTLSGAVTLGALARVEASAVLSGSEVASEAVVGAGAVVRDGKVGKHGVLASGSTLVGQDVAEGELWAGAPAVFVRKLTAEEVAALVAEAESAAQLAAAHAYECGKTHDEIEAEKLREELLRDRSDDYHSHLGITGQEESFIETQARIVEAERALQQSAGRAK